MLQTDISRAAEQVCFLYYSYLRAQGNILNILKIAHTLEQGSPTSWPQTPTTPGL